MAQSLHSFPVQMRGYEWRSFSMASEQTRVLIWRGWGTGHAKEKLLSWIRSYPLQQLHENIQEEIHSTCLFFLVLKRLVKKKKNNKTLAHSVSHKKF